MKKLLSILAISGIVGSSSSVVVACDEGSTGKTDISGMQFAFNPGYTLGSIYDSVRNDIAKKVGLKYQDIKTGSEKDSVYVSVFKDSEWIAETDATKIAVGDVITVKVMVTDASTHFQAMAWKDFTSTIAKVDLSNLEMPSITAKLTGVDATNLVRRQIEKLTASPEGTIKDNENVKIAVWNGEKQVDTSADLLDSSKPLQVKIMVTNDDANYAQMDWKVFTVTFANETTINKDTVKLSTDIVKVGEHYSDIYDAARNQIAAAAKIDSQVILDGIEKDNVLLFMKVNDKNVGSTYDTIAAGDKVEVGFQVTATSKYYNEVKTTIYSDPITVAKVTVSEDTLKGMTFKVEDKYSTVYDQIRAKLAELSGLTVADIKNSISVVIWATIDGKRIADSATQIQDGQQDKTVQLEIYIANEDKNFNKTGTMTAPTKINLGTVAAKS